MPVSEVEWRNRKQTWKGQIYLIIWICVGAVSAEKKEKEELIERCAELSEKMEASLCKVYLMWCRVYSSSLNNTATLNYFIVLQ